MHAGGGGVGVRTSLHPGGGKTKQVQLPGVVVVVGDTHTHTQGSPPDGLGALAAYGVSLL